MRKISIRRMMKPGRGLLFGVVAAAVAATAAGAAPNVLNPFSDSGAPHTTEATTTTIKPSDPIQSGHAGDATTEPPTTAAPTTEAPPTTQHETPATTAPASKPVDEPTTAAPTTEAPTTAAATTEAPVTTQATETTVHHEPTPTTTKSTEPPATTAPHTEPPHTEPPHTDAPTTVPSGDASTSTTVHVEHHAPTTMVLACSIDGVDRAAVISCNWSGDTPGAFAKLMLLRGKVGGQGRVPFQSSDPSANSFADTNVEPGTYSYVVVVVDASNVVLGHSNSVAIVVPAG